MNRHRAVIAAAFIAIGIVEFAILNLIFNPGYIWFYYAAFAALWWPLAELLPPGKNPTGFALAGSAMTAVFLAAVNFQNSPGYPWFLYSVYPLVWWPVGVFFSSRQRFRSLSLVGSALTVAYFVALNLLFSPSHPWFLYACYPLLWWPIAIHLGRKAGTLAFAAICSFITIAYYTALNIFISPGYPWAIYPAYAILWWPMALFFAKKKQWMGFSLAAGLMTVVFFITVNIVSSPGVIWAIYPIFAVLWWPMSLFFARRRNWFGFSVAGVLLFTIFISAVNLITSPGTLWAIYPIFAVLWWPMSLFFAQHKNWFGFSVAGALLFTVFISAVNRITSPGTPWAFYPVFAVLWWPVSMFFARHKNWFGYSVAGALLFSVFISAVNLVTSPGTLWAVYPVFAVLWWPLSMYFFQYRKMKRVQ